MGRRIALYRTVSRTFNTPIRPLSAFGLFQVRNAISKTAMALDSVIFPGWRKQALDRPIFIIGNPRSGTTFLHRLLMGTGDVATFEMWEMLFPAISARKALGGIMPRLDKLNPAQYHSSDAHETSLRGVETDDLLTFFNTLDGPFAWAYFHAWEDTWGSAEANHQFGIGDVDSRSEEAFFQYNEKCWKRNLKAKNKTRILVKSSMLTFRIKALLRRYPDAKLLYIARDPVETIPSGMSLLSGALENAFDIWNKTTKAQQEHWLDNLYRASTAMFESFHEAYTGGEIPEKNLLIVRYPDLIQNLEQTIKEVLSFIEVDAPQEFLDEVREQSSKQKKHSSKHGYSPEQYGLTAEQIREDLDFVYRTYGLGNGVEGVDS